MPISASESNAEPHFGLAGRRALVTGASRGIGRALALALGAAGAQVIVHARRLDHLEEVLAELAALGAKAQGASGDLASRDAVRQVAADALAGGPVDILVNNAGMASRGMLQDIAPEALMELLAVNVSAGMQLAQALVPDMIQRGWGRVINLGSPYGSRPAAGLGAYCISKAAVGMLTQCMALEWAGSGVTANAIAPIQVLTGLTRASYDDPKRRALIDAQIPMGRWARPEDLQGALLLLASSASDMMTGQVLFIDGGRMLV